MTGPDGVLIEPKFEADGLVPKIITDGQLAMRLAEMGAGNVTWNIVPYKAACIRTEQFACDFWVRV